MTETPDDIDDEQCVNAEQRLDDLIEAARRVPPSARAALLAETRAAVLRADEIKARRPKASDREICESDLERWRQVHRYVHATPYRDRAHPKRSAQWSDVLPRVREIGERELIDWVALQVEVAANREKGVPDMRPRKNGPTLLVMLEYVANRKRKALALLKWAIAAETEGAFVVDEAFHAETSRILAKLAAADDGCGEEPQIKPDDPLTRS